MKCLLCVRQRNGNAVRGSARHLHFERGGFKRANRVSRGDFEHTLIFSLSQPNELTAISQPTEENGRSENEEKFAKVVFLEYPVYGGVVLFHGC